MPAKAQAILLAAGRGERMRPLTDTCPKPLLKVRGKPLMQWPMEALARGGFRHLVVNTAWLGDQIEQTFGNGAELTPALSLAYSHEGRDFGGALETAGGIVRALPLLEEVFWVLAGDVFAPDFSFTQAAVETFKASGKLAHIWLVPNPAHNPLGDFGLGADGLALNLAKDSPSPKFTYSTIGLYRRALFTPPFCAIEPGNAAGARAALAPILRSAMDAQQVSGGIYRGLWADVGTPQRLNVLNQSENVA
jgi:N-acetyl-alpha-D-muramate 1-phosphate uridylyltransferase